MESSASSGKRCAETATPESNKVSKTAEGSAPGTGSSEAANEQQQQQQQRQQQAAAAAPEGATLQLRCAVSSDKGTRTTMEDVHVCLLAATDSAADTAEASRRVSHFAIYDGHGGSECAHFVSERLHDAVLAAGLLTQKKVATATASAAVQQPWQLDIKAAKQAVVKGFTQTDQQLLEECAQRNWQDGATAVAVWIVGDIALVANVGDAKCVLARTTDKPGDSGQLRALVLTKDHLAMYPAERSRIEKAGGHVSADGRLNGRIQVSRAFGDAQFKGFGSSASPDVTAFSISSRDHFMLCACDGFWGVMDPQGAVALAQQQLQAGKDEKAVANRLLNEAVIERKCKDNCTVMLVRFQQ